jgi:hypothetical protein
VRKAREHQNSYYGDNNLTPTKLISRYRSAACRQAYRDASKIACYGRQCLLWATIIITSNPRFLNPRIAELLTALGATGADLGTDAAGARVQIGTQQHEIGARPANLRAGEQQLNMVGLRQVAACLQTIRHRLQANTVVAQTFVDTLLYVRTHLLFSVTSHNSPSISLGESNYSADRPHPRGARVSKDFFPYFVRGPMGKRGMSDEEREMGKGWYTH